MYNIFVQNEWNLNFKKRILKIEISTFKSLSYFLSLCEFGNFYIQKIMSWKRWENFWLAIVKTWSFSYKIIFYKCSYDFLFLSYSQVKLNRDSDFDCL